MAEMTASEPLSLMEEYDMQEKWLVDDDKCTFILHAPTFTRNHIPFEQQHPQLDPSVLGGMLGDVNLFLLDADYMEEETDRFLRRPTEFSSRLPPPSPPLSPPSIKRAEVEIMVAEKGCRGQGLAREAIQCMLHYGHHQLGIHYFYAKVHESNAASLHLFQHHFQFQEIHRSAVFQEVTLLKVWRNNTTTTSDESTHVLPGRQPSPYQLLDISQ